MTDATDVEELTLEDIFARNKEYAKEAPSGYHTKLDPDEEKRFKNWVKLNNVPFDPSDKQSDYDMRGFYKALRAGDAKATSGINPNDGLMHFPDYWKTPYHESFSAESQWAKAGAPTWNQKDQLVTPDGRIVFDEPAVMKARQNRKTQ